MEPAQGGLRTPIRGPLRRGPHDQDPMVGIRLRRAYGSAHRLVKLPYHNHNTSGGCNRCVFGSFRPHRNRKSECHEGSCRVPVPF